MNPNIPVRGARTPRTRIPRFPVGLFNTPAAATPSPPHSGSSSEYIPEEESDSSDFDGPAPLRRVTRSSTRRALVTPTVVHIPSSESESAHSTPSPASNAAADVLIAMCSGQHAARSPTTSPSRTAAAIIGISSVVALKSSSPISDHTGSHRSDDCIDSLIALSSMSPKPAAVDATIPLAVGAVGAGVSSSGGAVGAGGSSSGTGRLRAQVSEIAGLVRAKALSPLAAYLRLTDFISAPNSVCALLRKYADAFGYRVDTGMRGEEAAFTAVASRFCKLDADLVQGAIDKCFEEVEYVKSVAESKFESVLNHLGINLADDPLLKMVTDLREDGKTDILEIIDAIVKLDQ